MCDCIKKLEEELTTKNKCKVSVDMKILFEVLFKDVHGRKEIVAYPKYCPICGKLLQGYYGRKNN